MDDEDPDGTSGANLDMLQYCQKWYPDTVAVVELPEREAIVFYNAGNNGISRPLSQYSNVSNQMMEQAVAPVVVIQMPVMMMQIVWLVDIA